MKRNIKHQVLDVVIQDAVNGIDANTISSVTTQLDNGYDVCTGVRLVELQNGGVTNYEVGINDDSGIVHHRTHNTDWKFDVSADMRSRTKPMHMLADGNNVEVVVKNTGAAIGTGEAIKLQVIFELEKLED